MTPYRRWLVAAAASGAISGLLGIGWVAFTFVVAPFVVLGVVTDWGEA